MIEATTPVAISTVTETNAPRERRGTTTASALTRRARVAAASTTSPISPPTHTAPALMCTQSIASETPRGEYCAAGPAGRRVLGGVAGGAGDEHRRGERRAHADEREQLGHRAQLALGLVEAHGD